MIKLHNILKIIFISFVFTISPVLLNAAANLRYNNYSWTQVSGNGDSVINPGESIYVSVNIKNTGVNETYDVDACLTKSDSYVSASCTSYWQAYYGTIGAGLSKNATSGGYNGAGEFYVKFDNTTPAGHVVTFTLNMKDGYGNTWTDSFSMKVAGPPVAPTGFSGIAQSPTSILWTWTDNSDDETGFYIQDNKHSNLKSLSADTTSWLETGLSPNTSYSRHVNAYNSSGSRDSNSASSTTFPIPGPTDFTGVAQSPSSILWSWTDNSDDETGFQIHDGAGNIVTSLSANITSWLETGLAPNTSYTRHVNGYYSYGNKDSNSVSLYTLSSPPTNLSANGNLIESSIAIYWLGNGGTRFAVERALDSNGSPATWSIIKKWENKILSETCIDSNLTGNTKYWYRVKGYNGDGIINDTPSNEISAVTLPDSAISKPKVEVYNNLINPVKNQTVYITCNLPQDENITVIIYDLLGHEIKKIVDNEHKNSGINIFEWVGKNYDDEVVASGSYIVYIKAGSYKEKKKILVIK